MANPKSLVTPQFIESLIDYRFRRNQAIRGKGMDATNILLLDKGIQLIAEQAAGISAVQGETLEIKREMVGLINRAVEIGEFVIDHTEEADDFQEELLKIQKRCSQLVDQLAEIGESLWPTT